MKKTLIVYLIYLMMFLIGQWTLFIALKGYHVMVFMNLIFVSITYVFALLFGEKIRKRPYFSSSFMLLLFFAIALCSMLFLSYINQ